MTELPILNCDDCGACCMEQSSPPGFAILCSPMANEFLAEDPDFPDVRIWNAMPESLRQSLRDYYQRCYETGDWRVDKPCCWFDTETKRCRHYEHRPTVCREFEVGSEGCRAWRDEYNIDVDRIKALD